MISRINLGVRQFFPHSHFSSLDRYWNKICDVLYYPEKRPRVGVAYTPWLIDALNTTNISYENHLAQYHYNYLCMCKFCAPERVPE